ncbi:hypothetical protein AK812_SmicGene12712 [Symbiodinium microadriaticum]|uniref:Uncharacterized protein n=1 Tax=Symbiodinium microadriaticum TaxID=2951 RepID=A0A1Q9E9Z5_SYMMI|nr:hypothetical protein AK812_SmicGene12712 [Symbiodinium microadriaticum]
METIGMVKHLGILRLPEGGVPLEDIELNGLLSTLSDTGDTIERWFKASPRALQHWQERLLQGPSQDVSAPVTAAAAEAKKFQQIDKDWIKIMQSDGFFRVEGVESVAG